MAFTIIWHWEYLLFLLFPILTFFILPILLIFFIIISSAIYLNFYGLFKGILQEEYTSSAWDGARANVSKFFNLVGKIWHGYEIHGLDHIPDEGPALIIAYHATVPLDLYFLIAKLVLCKKRTPYIVAFRPTFKCPGIARMYRIFCATPGSVDECTSILKAGNLLIIAPGGVTEGLLSGPDKYEIIWRNRLGFAKVALGSNAPIIPIFTENCRDAFRVPKICGRPLCFPYGGFPVKLITHIGPTVIFSPDSTPEEVKEATKEAVSSLIKEHQRLPGNILVAMGQRICKKKKKLPKEIYEEKNRNEENEKLSPC